MKTILALTLLLILANAAASQTTKPVVVSTWKFGMQAKRGRLGSAFQGWTCFGCRLKKG